VSGKAPGPGMINNKRIRRELSLAQIFLYATHFQVFQSISFAVLPKNKNVPLLVTSFEHDTNVGAIFTTEINSSLTTIQNVATFDRGEKQGNATA